MMLALIADAGQSHSELVAAHPWAAVLVVPIVFGPLALMGLAIRMGERGER